MISVPRTIFEDEHRIFRDSVSRFIEAEIVPHHATWEEVGQVPRAAWLKAGEAGLLLCSAPEAFGGGGGTFLHSAVVIEEMARFGVTGPSFPLHSDVVAPYLVAFGTPEQKSKWLPEMARGAAPGAIAMTEPDAGSDLKGMRTTVRPEGDELVINGAKTYISNARGSAFVIVACKDAGEGLSLVLVEAGTPGFELGRRFEKIGCKAQDLSELFFNDCRVPAGNLIGTRGQGMRHLMEMLPQERLLQAVRAVAAAEAMLGWTIDHVRQRRAFGRPLAGFQAIGFRLAELHAEIMAQRVLVDRCLSLHVTAGLDAALAASLKMSTCELQGRVADACLQMFGAAGYMWETPIARAFADARQARIAGGTVEIMKVIVSRALLNPD